MVYLYDRNNGSLLSVEDVFSDVDELNVIGELYFRKMFDLSPNEDLGDAGFWFDNNQFSVNENFSFSNSVVTFHYNTYEIAPYANGPTDLEIPIREVKHLLLKEL